MSKEGASTEKPEAERLPCTDCDLTFKNQKTLRSHRFRLHQSMILQAALASSIISDVRQGQLAGKGAKQGTSASDTQPTASQMKEIIDLIGTISDSDDDGIEPMTPPPGIPLETEFTPGPSTAKDPPILEAVRGQEVKETADMQSPAVGNFPKENLDKEKKAKSKSESVKVKDVSEQAGTSRQKSADGKGVKNKGPTSDPPQQLPDMSKLKAKIEKTGWSMNAGAVDETKNPCQRKKV